MLAPIANVQEIAELTGMSPALVQRFIELRLIVPKLHYTEAELSDLRRARRLVYDLGFDAEVVEVVLRMRARILALQRQIAQLQFEMHK